MKKLTAKSLMRAVAIGTVSLSTISAGLVFLPSVASAGGAPDAGLILLNTTPTTSAPGNIYASEFDLYVAGTAPTGTVTITDSNSNSCQSSSPSYIGGDGGGGEIFEFYCFIVSPESGGTTVSASYAGSDYIANTSNTLTVGPTYSTLTQNSDPVTSETGNTITETLAASTTITPVGTVTVTESNTDSCTASSWTDVGSNGFGGDTYQTSCALTDSEEGGEEINASYSGPDYFANNVAPIYVGAANAGLSLSGSPTPGSNNEYTVTVDAPTDLVPNGTAIVEDSNANVCPAWNWVDSGPDGSGGELFSAQCNITQSESVGNTISAIYSGSDYTTPTSNTLIIETPAALYLDGYPATSSDGNSYSVLLDAPTNVTPTGYAEVLDSGGHSCEASSWSYFGQDESGGYLFYAECNITQPESGGETTQASYVGSDYTTADSSPLSVSAANGVIGFVTTNPETSQSGNSFYVEADVPTNVTPSGTATITDSNSNACTTDTWTNEGGDGSGGELFWAHCVISQAESGGVTASVYYSGTDYSLTASGTETVHSVAATLALAGTPETSATGNSYTVTVDSYVDLSPTTQATVTDSNNNSCNASSWTNEGSDGAGGYDFSATCTISSAEAAGVTVFATYAGSDYTTGASNTITVAKAAATLTLSGTTPAGPGNVYTIDVISPTDLAPVGSATVTDSNSSSCTGSTWTLAGTNLSGDTIFSTTCTMTASQIADATVTAAYTGSDYTTPVSNQLKVGTAAGITSANITGNPYVGSALTANAVGVVGAPTPTVTYLWYANGTSISSSNSPTYTVLSADLGEVISVRITETNDIAGPASATSANTAPVTNPPAPPVSTTTTTIPTTTTTTPPPVVTPTVPVRRTLTLGFPPKSSTLNARDTKNLRSWAKGLTSGEHVRVAGYGNKNRDMAKKRAKVVAAFLKAKYGVTVTFRYSTSAANKVVVSAIFG
jgi:outer membrane protein OmpA-like peptidoglycan-associated protein